MRILDVWLECRNVFLNQEIEIAAAAAFGIFWEWGHGSPQKLQFQEDELTAELVRPPYPVGLVRMLDWCLRSFALNRAAFDQQPAAGWQLGVDLAYTWLGIWSVASEPEADAVLMQRLLEFVKAASVRGVGANAETAARMRPRLGMPPEAEQN